MPWYGWLFLILLIAVIAAWIIWWLVLKASQAKLRTKIGELEKDLELKIVLLEDARKAQIQAEKIVTEKRLEELEATHKEKLENLSKEEKIKYEEIKKNTQLGINYILNLLDE